MALSSGGVARSVSIDQIRAWLDGSGLPGGANVTVDQILANSPLNVSAGIFSRSGNRDAIAARHPTAVATAGSGLVMELQDDGGATQGYGRISAHIVTNTAGAEDGEVVIGTVAGGTFADKVHINEDGDILPETTEVQDLGSAASEWQDIYTQNAVTVSDQRRKRDIEDASVGMAFLRALLPVTFRWRNLSVPERRGPNGELRREARTQTYTRKHYGLLAQEVKQTLDVQGIATDDFAPYVDANRRFGVDALGLRYGQFIPILIKALQELDARVMGLGG